MESPYNRCKSRETSACFLWYAILRAMPNPAAPVAVGQNGGGCKDHLPTACQLQPGTGSGPRDTADSNRNLNSLLSLRESAEYPLEALGTSV
jgi:hypothetical protein